MALQPLISVIVPCYNQAEFMDECLESVLNQTYTNWECIIVNDGSPDHTEEIALQWAQKDSRFKYLKKENGGLSSARNAGIKVGQGEWILPLDCDDKIGNKYLELVVNEINLGFNLIYTKVVLFGSTNKELLVESYDYNKLFFRNPFYCSCVFSKKNWELIGGYDINLIYGMEDWEFWINMISNLDIRVKRIDYLGFFYRRKEISMNTIIESDENKNKMAKEYIQTKHIRHYVNLLDVINESFDENIRFKLYLSKYDRLFGENLLGRILYKIATQFNGK